MNHLQLDWGSLYQPIFQFIQSKVHNKEIAEDILHNSFLKVQKALPQLKNSERLLSWTYTIVRNTIQDHYRSITPQSELVEELEQTEKTESLSSWHNCVSPMLDTLAPKYKEALQLHDLQGLSQKEVAQQLDISYSGAKSRIQRARKQLKKNFVSCCNVNTDAFGNLLGEPDCTSPACSS